MDEETPSQKVYNNSLIFEEILRHLDKKKDVLSCLVTSRFGFLVGACVLYDVIDDKALGRAVDKACSIERFQIYARAVRVLCLTQPIFPASINITSLRSLYPNINRILFNLPGFGQLRRSRRAHEPPSAVTLAPTAHQTAHAQERDIAARPAAVEDGQGRETERRGSSISPVLSGSLYLAVTHKPNWGAVNLTSQEFGITGQGQRFLLKGLALGKMVAYRKEKPIVAWDGSTGILDFSSEEICKTILSGLEEFNTIFVLNRQNIRKVVSVAPHIRHVAIHLAGSDKPTPGRSLKEILWRRLRDQRIEDLEHTEYYGFYPNLPGAYSLATERIPSRITLQVNFEECGSEQAVGVGPVEVYKTFPGETPRTTNLTIVVGQSVMRLSPFAIASNIARKWPPYTIVQIEPYFFEPSLEQKMWIKEVLFVRRQLTWLATQGSQGPRGYRLLAEEDDEAEAVESEMDSVVGPSASSSEVEESSGGESDSGIIVNDPDERAIEDNPWTEGPEIELEQEEAEDESGTATEQEDAEN